MGEVEKFAPEDIETTWRRAKGYALSGYFADAKSAEQAFVKISAGAEMGLTPFQAMSGIFIIDGKPVVGAGLLAAMVDQHDEYDYTVTWTPDAANATACTVTILKNGVVKGESTFSMEDAKRAGLDKPSRNGKPSNYNVYGRNMLFARAMSNAVRWYAPGVTGTSTYVEGEIPTFASPQPEHVEAKPRVRVTAEVIRDEPVVGEVLDPDPVTIPFIAEGGLKDALSPPAFTTHQRAELFAACGIPPKATLSDIRTLLWIKWADLGLPDDQKGEPVPVTLLGAIYSARAAARPDDAAEAFQRFADTGEDLDAGDQATLTAEMQA